MSHFLIRLTPPRDTFVDDATDEELIIINKHFEYLKNLMSKDKLILAGRTVKGEIGIAIINASDIYEAQNLMENDPAVKSEIFMAEVYKFQLSLLHN